MIRQTMMMQPGKMMIMMKSSTLQQQQEQQQCAPLPKGYKPSSHTVLVGRGRVPRLNMGNKRLRALAQSYLKKYQEGGKKCKTQIVSDIIYIIRNACKGGKGAFVKHDKKNGRWYDLGDHVAREKVGYVFRDLLANAYKSSSKSKVASRRRQPKEDESLSSIPTKTCGGVLERQVSVEASQSNTSSEQHEDSDMMQRSEDDNDSIRRIRFSSLNYNNTDMNNDSYHKSSSKAKEVASRCRRPPEEDCLPAPSTTGGVLERHLSGESLQSNGASSEQQQPNPKQEHDSNTMEGSDNDDTISRIRFSSSLRYDPAVAAGDMLDNNDSWCHQQAKYTIKDIFSSSSDTLSQSSAFLVDDNLLQEEIDSICRWPLEPSWSLIDDEVDDYDSLLKSPLLLL